MNATDGKVPPQKIRIGDKWYVAATSAGAEEQPQTLKDDDTFAMFDRFGDIQAIVPGKEGIYRDDTRFLSHLQLTVDGARPLYLGSSIEEGNNLLVIDLMNPDIGGADGVAALQKGLLHLFRGKLLWRGACHEHVRVANHGQARARVRIGLAWAADFVDLFEVRGMTRERRGDAMAPELSASEVVLPYRGLDDRMRRTRITFDPPPAVLEGDRAEFELVLEPGMESHLYMTIACEADEPSAKDAPVVGGNALLRARPNYHAALRDNIAARGNALAGRCHIETSNPLVNLWLDRSVSDLWMLTTRLPTGPYPYAGVPWYSTTFGRDGILTALEYLWVDPALGRGVLAFLAKTQATAFDPSRDAEPGKILHEARRSEMAATREIPFGRYYGTVDATPLFLVLAAAWFHRTADLEFIRTIWPNILAALEWIDTHGDADGDGFVEYSRKSAEGLVQQGWKDSHDSVFHQDGQLAEAPIALCEVQGYVYEGKLGVARIARQLGETELAERLDREAAALRARFQRDFWNEELGTYVIALDGRKRQCRIASSNAGHVLWNGIAAPDHAQRVIDGLSSPAFFSGWGIRTIASGEARYNPMSYHNGSIWPHDNALAALGMSRYGRSTDAANLFASLFDASLHFDSNRLPELFCGFPRRAGAGPTLYPVACSPQAWAAASVFAMLQACLGLEVDAEKAQISLRSPQLPGFIDWVRITRLGVDSARPDSRGVDLILKRYERNVGIEVLRKDPDVTVSVLA